MIKKIVAGVAVLILLISSLLVMPAINHSLAEMAASVVGSAKGFQNVYWQPFIASFGISGILVSIVILCSIFINKINLHTQMVLCGVFISALLIFIGIIVYNYSVNWIKSDHSSEMVLGKLLANENKLVSSNWKYSTELRLFYQQIFMMPLFKLFNNWRLVRALTVLFNNILLLCSFFFMMGHLKVELKYIMLTSIFLLVPINTYYWDTVTFGGYYVFFLAMFLFLLGLFAILTNYKDRKTNKLSFCIFCILSVMLGMGGIRALLDIQTPLFITCFIAYYFNKPHSNKNYFRLGLISLLLCIVGSGFNFLLHAFFKFHSFAGTGLTNFHNQLFQKLGNTIVEFLEYFGYRPDSKMFSPAGVFSILSVFLLMFIIIASIKLVKENYSITNGTWNSKTFFLLFFIVTSVFHSVLFLFLENDAVNSRYNIPFMFLYVPVLAILFEQIVRKFHAAESRFIICLMVITIFGTGALNFQNIVAVNHNDVRQGYITYLEKNKLRFGFASYWNANVTTEITNGTVEMVGLNPENIHAINNWLLPVLYDDPNYYKGETFLLLTGNEYETYKNEDWLSQKKAGYSDKDFILFRYPSEMIVFKEMLRVQ
ncbi:hypothetical protein FACS1894190_15290 [Spirochaetia bacterium]|nr:hypothetical protein FACS1894190_15290 [Spirochaetia bacterium]